MKKTVLLYLLSVLSLNFFLNEPLSAQHTEGSDLAFNELKENFDRLNGPDYILLNGRQYEALNAGNSHPYFNTEQYRPGRLVLNGKRYENVMINYDIADQQLNLQYPTNSGQDLKVVLNRAMIDQFQIDGLTFRLMSFPETGTAFFQVISSGDLSCFLLWEKALFQSAVSGSTTYKYSKQSREVHIQMEGRLYVIKNSSSFTSMFEEAYRKEIKLYLRREKIQFRDASEEQLEKLMDFCTGLLQSG